MHPRPALKSRNLLLIFAAALAFSAASAQSYEFGVTAGAANYYGDLSPLPVLKETKPMAGLLFQYNPRPYTAFGVSLCYAQVSGSDANFTQNRPRNLSFRSDILEAAGTVDFHFFKYAQGVRSRNWTPYLYTGLAITRFNPQANTDSGWFDLRPLNTEGQGFIDGQPKPYKDITLAIPLGAGFKVRFADRWSMNFNVGFRATFTDYLDDVSTVYVDRDILAERSGNLALRLYDRSPELGYIPPIGEKGHQRGNPDNKDWYVFSGLSILYVLADPGCPSMGKPPRLLRDW